MKLAIVTSGALPVPAVKGGAVEVLTSHLINENESINRYSIDLYTIKDTKLDSIQLKNTKIIQIACGRIFHLFYRIRNIVACKLLKRKYKSEYTELLCKEINKHEYDYVLIENQLHLVNSIYEKTKHKNNLLVHLHNNIDDSRNPQSAKVASDRLKGIIVISEYLRRLYSEYMAPDKIFVLPNCVSDSFVKHDFKSTRNTYRNKFGVSENEFLFFFSGRIEPYKGVLELLQTFKELCKQHSNIKLMIVGDDFLKSKSASGYVNLLKGVASSISNNVVFTGFVNPTEMPAVLSMADCVVIPSTWEEPFGVVALEAMAEGIPVIATNSGALPEILINGTAIIVDKGIDLSKLLQEAMHQMVIDVRLREQMSFAQNLLMKEKPEYGQVQYYKNFCDILDNID